MFFPLLKNLDSSHTSLEPDDTFTGACAISVQVKGLALGLLIINCAVHSHGLDLGSSTGHHQVPGSTAASSERQNRHLQ